MRRAIIAVILLLALTQSAQADQYLDLAELYAPVWYQDTASRYRADFITSYDYDGDRIGNNNWEGIDGHGLLAHTYYSVIETETHYFIHYFIFWPQDWFSIDSDTTSHENDMEGAMVVVAKEGAASGEVLLVETSAENHFYQWSSHPDVSEGEEDIDGGVLVEEGSHPRIFAAAMSHHVLLDDTGIIFGVYVGQSGEDFPGGDGVVYRYTGTAEQPSDANDRDVGYSLVSIYDDLWPDRLGPYGTGNLLDCPLQYTGTRFSLPNYLGNCFDGDTFEIDAGATPWGLDDPDDDLNKGDWLMDPAETVDVHLDVRGDFSLDYVYNPFLEELAAKITSTANTECGVDEPYQYDEDGRAEATGHQPIFWSLVAGPDDLEIEEGSGRITWKPDSYGDYTITIRARNSAGADDQTFTVDVGGFPDDDDDDDDDDDNGGDDDGGRSSGDDDGAGCCG